MGQAALQLVQITSGSLAHPEILVLSVPRVLEQLGHSLYRTSQAQPEHAAAEPRLCPLWTDSNQNRPWLADSTSSYNIMRTVGDL